MKRPPSTSSQNDKALQIIQKRQQIQDEIISQMYRVPDEEELSREYEEMQKAEDLRGKWKQLKQQEEQQQAVINKVKLEKIEGEQKRLASRLEELINTPLPEEQEDKYKIVALKRRIEQDYRDELQKLNEQFLISKEHDIEKIVRKKIEMEKLIEQKKNANDRLMKLQVELETIQEVKDKKDLNSKKLLQNALNRVGVPSTFISDKDKILLSDAILDDQIEAEKQRDQILKEVQQRVNQQISNLDMETQERLRILNDKRGEIHEKQERILREKAVHGELMKKGIDYLTQVELGLAPPFEYLKKNLVMDEDKVDEYRTTSDITQISKKNRRFVADAEYRIEDLRQNVVIENFNDKPYNNEIKPYLNRKNPESLFIARKIVDYIIDNSLRQVLEKENRIARMKELRKDYDKRGRYLKRTQNYLIDQEFIDEMADRIFATVMKRVQKEASHEIAVVNTMAQSVALNIIVNSVKLERNTSNKQERIRELYYELRGDGLQKQETGIKFNFLNQDQIIWDKVKKGKKTYNKKELLKNLKEKKTGMKDVEEKKKKPEEQDEDLDVQILDPVNCQENLGLDKWRDLEIQYWEQISMTSVNFKNHSIAIKSSISCLQLSPFKDMILLGMSNGEISMYDTSASPAVIQAIVPSFNISPVIDIQFGMDNVGHLLVLDASGQTRFCYNAYNLKVNIPKDQLKGIEQLPEGYQPMFYVQYLTIEKEHFARTNKKLPNKITYSIFNPAITFSCLQPYLFLGSDDGAILKYNSNASLYDGMNYKFPLHDVLNSRIIVNEDEPFPNENFMNIQEIPKENEARHPHFFREFFQSHKAPIMFIGFIEQPEHIITIDQDGYLNYWEYDNVYYQLKERSFRPKLKLKVLLEAPFFSPEVERKKTFPHEGVQNAIMEGMGIYIDYFKEEQSVQSGSDNEGEEDKERPQKLNILYEKNLKGGDLEVLVCKEDLPQDGDMEIFEILRLNHASKTVKEVYQQDFKASTVSGYIAKTKSTQCGKYIYLEIIKPHYINTELVIVEFVAINTQTFKLKTLKPQLETILCDSVEFDIVDNYYPFMVSYLFVHMPTGIVIISLATGCILKTIQDHIPNVRVTFQAKQLIPKGIQAIENESIFYTYENANGCWRLEIKDNNEENESQTIYDNISTEYLKLFLS